MSAIVLLSGGLDSAVCLARAVQEHKKVMTLTFDYGQKARVKEIEAAANLARFYGVPQDIITLDFLKSLTKTALVNSEEQPPEPEGGQLDDTEGAALESAKKVWVPNRNGLFINIAACYAESGGYEWIVSGFNREEAATFPDNSKEFVNTCNSALEFSTLSHPKVVSYTQDLDKFEIVKTGQKLKLPFKYIWSCYHGNSQMCGQCESCQRFYRALKSAGIQL